MSTHGRVISVTNTTGRRLTNYPVVAIIDGERYVYRINLEPYAMMRMTVDDAIIAQGVSLRQPDGGAVKGDAS